MTLGGLDDVELVLELSCGAWSWRHVAVLFHILHASWSLLSLRVGFLKPLLLEPRDTSWVLYKELVLSLSVGAKKIYEDRDLPQAYCI